MREKKTIFKNQEYYEWPEWAAKIFENTRNIQHSNYKKNSNHKFYICMNTFS